MLPSQNLILLFKIYLLCSFILVLIFLAFWHMYTLYNPDNCWLILLHLLRLVWSQILTNILKCQSLPDASSVWNIMIYNKDIFESLLKIRRTGVTGITTSVLVFPRDFFSIRMKDFFTRSTRSTVTVFKIISSLVIIISQRE